MPRSIIDRIIDMSDFKTLLSRQIEFISMRDPAFILPGYDGLSLANLPRSICQWLGVPGIGEARLDASYPFAKKHYDQVILFVIDGLGWNRFERWIQEESDCFSIWRELIESGQVSPLTSISPSTTCAVLTTLNTGVTPATHGNLAYELWLKEFGVVANMITHAPMAGGETGSLQKSGFRPTEFLPVPTLDTHLISNRVPVFALHPAGISHSSLTGALFPQAELHGYHSMGDLWFRLQQALANPRNLPAYQFIYWSEVDELSHIYGPDDIRAKLAFRDFSVYLRDLLKSHPKNVGHKSLLIITADHGLQATPVQDEYDLNRHPDLVDCLSILPTGENRLPFLHIKPGKEDQVFKYVEQTWPEKFSLFSSQQLLSSGLFGRGDIYSRTLDRLGDLVVVPQGEAYWWWSGKPNRLLGRHGGFSADEMLVPIAMIEL